MPEPVLDMPRESFASCMTSEAARARRTLPSRRHASLFFSICATREATPGKMMTAALKSGAIQPLRKTSCRLASSI